MTSNKKMIALRKAERLLIQAWDAVNSIPVDWTDPSEESLDKATSQICDTLDNIRTASVSIMRVDV